MECSPRVAAARYEMMDPERAYLIVAAVKKRMALGEEKNTIYIPPEQWAPHIRATDDINSIKVLVRDALRVCHLGSAPMMHSVAGVLRYQQYLQERDNMLRFIDLIEYPTSLFHVGQPKIDFHGIDRQRERSRWVLELFADADYIRGKEYSTLGFRGIGPDVNYRLNMLLKEWGLAGKFYPLGQFFLGVIQEFLSDSPVSVSTLGHFVCSFRATDTPDDIGRLFLSAREALANDGKLSKDARELMKMDDATLCSDVIPHVLQLGRVYENNQVR